MYSREDEPTSWHVIGCTFEVSKALEPASLDKLLAEYFSAHLRLFAFICVYLRSFAAKKKISGKLQGLGTARPLIGGAFVSRFLCVVPKEPHPKCDCRKMVYRIGPDFGSYSRRGNRRLVDYVTIDATRKMDEKTSKTVFHWTEIT